jgi:hypothetical protein
MSPGAIEDRAPTIELMSFGIGARIFEKFGHSALCLKYNDPRNTSVCFNYGVTDFSEGPIMIWHFLRTEQQFWVEPTSYGAMVAFYKWEDRDIWIQDLVLTPDEARAVEAKLWSDIKEENRYYYYDHFFDNCTTRLRDILDVATHGRLRAGSDAPYPLTFREIGVRGLAGDPWMIALADFTLGRQLDDTPTLWQAMFHPAILRDVVATKFAGPPQLIYARKGPPFPTESGTWRLQMFAISLLFSLPLLVASWRRRFVRTAVAWATVYLGLWGIALWGLAVISSIAGVRWNEVALVLVPLDFALPFLGPARRRAYSRVRVAGLMGVSMLAAVGVFHQPLWIPILAAFVPHAILAFDLPHGLVAMTKSVDAVPRVSS